MQGRRMRKREVVAASFLVMYLLILTATVLLYLADAAGI